jgi:hypothetical protein
MLLFIHVKAILKRSHVSNYSRVENVDQPFIPPAGGRQFTPIALRQGHSCRIFGSYSSRNKSRNPQEEINVP